MSVIEIKSEVIRLVNEIDEGRMEDLLSSIKMFIEQQESHEIDVNEPDLLKSLNESLNRIGQDDLLSNDEVIKETKEWLTR